VGVVFRGEVPASVVTAGGGVISLT